MKYVVYQIVSYKDGDFPKFIGIYDQPQELEEGFYQEAVPYFCV